MEVPNDVGTKQECEIRSLHAQIAALRKRADAAEKERDEARKVADSTCRGLYSQHLAERDKLRAENESLQAGQVADAEAIERLKEERDEIKVRWHTETGVARAIMAEKECERLRSEVERLKTPICVGPETIKVLAERGQFSCEHGFLIAADGLYAKDPYARLDALETAATEEGR